MRALIVLMVVAGCGASAPPPPDRAPAGPPVVTVPDPELPPAPAWMNDELAMFEYVVGLLAEDFREVEDVGLEVADTEQAALFEYVDGTVVASPFPRDVPALRRVIDRWITGPLGGRAAFTAGFETTADALESVRVVALAALAHELCWQVQDRRRNYFNRPLTGHYIMSTYDRVLPCLEFEVAVLDQAIAAGDVPARWRDLYRRYHQVVLDAIPGRIRLRLVDRAAAQSDLDTRVEALRAARRVAGDGSGIVAWEDADTLTAYLARFRLELLDDPPTLETLRATWAPFEGPP